jgi:nucleoside-diphosphate-sugar epimerase
MPSPARKTVVVTGATGYVASQLLPVFRECYDLRLVDITKEGRGGRVVEDITVHDLREPDLNQHRPLFRGAQVVVHLAYNRARGFRNYLDERTNLDMAYHVYQCALDEGVERVVMASSNHAADWYEPLIHKNQKDVVLPDERPLATGYYGWAKASYEHMGFLYAQGAIPTSDARREGGPAGRATNRKLGVVQIRIGNPRGLEHFDFTGRPEALKRSLGAFISERDIAQLFRKSIDAPSIDNEHGVPFQIFYGISGNTRAFWSLTNARRVIGYAPQDDSELLYAHLVRDMLGASPGRVGASGDSANAASDAGGPATTAPSRRAASA